ncbi:hypothetical protein RN001_000062 [Aquatica leii]|uniref:Uncharacterized protein n=1 Tax=Aquatica leii TaxID=1421715 RepID=A0AAN7PLS8_9COLE|nr:hypothetical protein RN001_000062 [Aquatica leii]
MNRSFQKESGVAGRKRRSLEAKEKEKSSKVFKTFFQKSSTSTTSSDNPKNSASARPQELEDTGSSSSKNELVAASIDGDAENFSDNSKIPAISEETEVGPEFDKEMKIDDVEDKDLISENVQIIKCPIPKIIEEHDIGFLMFSEETGKAIITDPLRIEMIEHGFKHFQNIEVQEALEMILADDEEEFESDLSIAPPEPSLVSDEDSGDEDSGGDFNNFNRNQLLADAELRSRVLTDRLPNTVQEALEMILADDEEEFESDLFIAPPEPFLVSDEDSGDEDSGGDFNNFNRNQLLADAELKPQVLTDCLPDTGSERSDCISKGGKKRDENDAKSNSRSKGVFRCYDKQSSRECARRCTKSTRELGIIVEDLSACYTAIPLIKTPEDEEDVLIDDRMIDTSNGNSIDANQLQNFTSLPIEETDDNDLIDTNSDMRKDLSDISSAGIIDDLIMRSYDNKIADEIIEESPYVRVIVDNKSKEMSQNLTNESQPPEEFDVDQNALACDRKKSFQQLYQEIRERLQKASRKNKR